METALLQDFSGGLNYRDPAQSLEGNQTQDALNVTNLGKTLMKRRGAATGTTLASDAVYVFWSDAVSRLIVQRGGAVYALNADSAYSSATVIASTSTAKIACVDFNDVVVISTLEGIYTWNGSGSATLRLSQTIYPNAIGVWQNKVWAGDGARVIWSNAGDPTTWTTSTDYVDIMEPDGTPVEAIGVGNGIDVVGRDGIFVWKRNSIHRILDSETGEYITISAEPGGGGMGHECVTSLNGVTYFMNPVGMYRLAGDTVEKISDPIEPVGSFNYPNDFLSSCCWTLGGRVFFSRTSSGMVWEYVPESGAWWRHNFYTGSLYRYALSASTRGSNISDNEKAYVLDSSSRTILVMPTLTIASGSGSDYSNVSIPCSYACPWVSFGLDKARVRRSIIEGWGTNVAMSTKSNYQGALTSFDTDMDFATLDTRVYSGFEEKHSLGVHRAISLYFAESSSSGVAASPQYKSTLNPQGQYPSSFGLNSIRFDFVPLGRG